jgi:hypothetical protein
VPRGQRWGEKGQTGHAKSNTFIEYLRTLLFPVSRAQRTLQTFWPAALAACSTPGPPLSWLS